MHSTKTFFSSICILCITIFSFISLPSLANGNSATLFFQECNAGKCTDITDNEMVQNFEKGSSISLRIMIKNPENAPIYSVQSWIKYNSTVFSVENLSDDNSEFPLAAPGEFKAINDKGEIRIGRAVAGESVNSKEIIVADFILQVKKNPNGSVLEFIDFKTDDIGKTAVITIGNNVPANIVSEKPQNLTFIKLQSAPKIYSRPENLEEIQNGQNVYGIEREDNNSQAEENQNISNQQIIEVPRPQGFRSRTYNDGKIEHLWKIGDDKRITGYYLYYSMTSGKYMHRRDIGKTNIYRFKNDFFEKGKRIYFAVQAYTQDGVLSDFSDETYVAVGTEGSESHPFFEQIFPDAQKTGQDKDNIYYGADVTDENKSAQTNENIYAKPKTSPQSGLNIPFHWFLFFGGIIMFFGGRVLLNKN